MRRVWSFRDANREAMPRLLRHGLVDPTVQAVIMMRILGAYLLVIGGLFIMSAAQAEEKEHHAQKNGGEKK